jgi:hypothetical protein
MSRTAASSTLNKEFNIGDQVTFQHLPVKMNDYALREFRDLPFFAKGVVIGKKTKFTVSGNQLFVPYYDIKLPDDRVMEDVNPYYFQADWPKVRDTYEDAFKLIMKALKPLDLKRTRSEMRAGMRVLTIPYDMTVSFQRTIQLLKTLPNVKIGAASFPSTPFTVEMQTGENTFSKYEGAVSRRSMDGDELDRVTLDRIASGRMARANEPSRSPSTMSRSLTASDRSSLIRLASSLPVGTPERKAILAGLRSAGSKMVKHKDKDGNVHALNLVDAVEYDGTPSLVVHRDGTPIGKVFYKEESKRVAPRGSKLTTHAIALPPWNYEIFDESGRPAANYRAKGRGRSRSVAFEAILEGVS